MIHVNGTWGREPRASSGAAAIYRVQAGGKVRMSTVPAGHEGLGVEGYAWSSSPLRRYVDLVNQRQLIALARGDALRRTRRATRRCSRRMRDFELAHEAYGAVSAHDGALLVPALARCRRESRRRRRRCCARAWCASTTCRWWRACRRCRRSNRARRVELAISRIDLLELTFHCEFAGVRNPAALAPTGW